MRQQISFNSRPCEGATQITPAHLAAGAVSTRAPVKGRLAVVELHRRADGVSTRAPVKGRREMVSDSITAYLFQLAPL